MDNDKLFENNDETPPIKVTDHRKFAIDGTPLEPESVADDVAEPTTEPEIDVPISEATEPDETTPPSNAGSSQDAELPIDMPERNIADLPRDFSAFVEGIYLEAMLYMGAIPDPRNDETIENIELAKYKIDLLVMLESKTAGNLTAEEKGQVESVLYQLRMIYLEKTKSIKL